MEQKIPQTTTLAGASSTARVPELALIIPVYNEEDCIVSVLEEWTQAMRREKIPTLFIVVDDGSTDRTAERLKHYIRREEREDVLIVHQANQGHGQSCLNGYRKAIELKIPRIFQIDSDGQCDAEFFPPVWRERDRACAVYGRRRDRDDGWTRVLISWVLRQFLRVVVRTRLSDSNVPFRLYQSSYLEEPLTRIPKTFHLANIAIALLLEPRGFVEVPIHFRNRQGGHSNVKWLGFVRRALQLHRNLHELRTYAPPPKVKERAASRA